MVRLSPLHNACRRIRTQLPHFSTATRYATRAVGRPAPAQPATWIPAIGRAALLERETTGLGFLLFLPLPLLFVFTGAMGFYTVAFRVRRGPRVRRPANPVAGRRFVAGVLIVIGSALCRAFLLDHARHALAPVPGAPRNARSYAAKSGVIGDAEAAMPIQHCCSIRMRWLARSTARTATVFLKCPPDGRPRSARSASTTRARP